jgi:hypothetical protein
MGSDWTSILFPNLSTGASGPPVGFDSAGHAKSVPHHNPSPLQRMKTNTTSNANSIPTGFRCRGGWAQLAFLAALAFALTGSARAETQAAPIPFSQLGAKATADYHGDALGVAATPDGARLRCGFQKLEGRATAEGLWLESTAPGALGRLRLTATALCRESSRARECALTEPTMGEITAPTGAGGYRALAASGSVSVEVSAVRFTRAGVTEEYSVSVDGVRQDFVIAEQPAGEGDLQVELELTGARAEAAAYGAKLTLEGSGRALAYSRLRVADAAGQALTAHLDVLSADRLAVRVTDANAAYPIRIDPTFSDADWASLNAGRPGSDWDVYALAADGSGNLYVGGGFTFIGTVSANAIAKWNGSAWSALGSGMPDGAVVCLAIIGTNLYAGGEFTTAGEVSAHNIAQWDGSAWSALGEGMNAMVYEMAVSGTNLYAGGYFTTAGGVMANYIARWDGSVWSPLGEGMNNRVYAVEASGANVYAGGDFTTAGGAPANHVAQWDGSGWSPLGSGTDSTVEVLAASGTHLYAGGEFTTAGGVTVNYIARWDGTSWSALGSGMDWPVYALAVSGTDLYAGGDFGTAGDVPANCVAKWNGSSWSALGSGANGTVWVLAMSGTNLYAGGDFQVAGGETAFYIARWNDSNWSALTLGMDWNVYALALSGTDLYAGGGFTTAGEVVKANCIAKWNGSAWSALGSGMGTPDPYAYPSVYALAVSGTDLYAGGSFSTAGGVPAANIAKWNGSTWSALGSGLDDYVEALAVNGTNLYAGGGFSTAGGAPASRIAKWNGTAWSALGSGMSGGYSPYVSALAASGTDLYAGGSFSTAGGVSATNIAKWNGSAWSALGLGVNDAVSALVVSGANLYAGGEFNTAGGMAASYIAKWNGSAWSALGSGMGGNGYPYVHALVVSGTNLYAGGEFTTAGGVAANYIAKWDGSAWSALGSGVNSATTPTVETLVADSAGHLFVGGYFDLAGTNVSPFIAQANLISSPPGGVIQSIGVSSGSVTLDCQGVSGATYAVRRATDVRFTANLTTLLTTNVPPNGLFRCTDSSPPDTAAFYRLLKQ